MRIECEKHRTDVDHAGLSGSRLVDERLKGATIDGIVLTDLLDC
jgi:hypothetical protein